ncbi:MULTISPECIES: hypothetical protein [Rhodopirellula]|uniref:hypothetical protein n=1 Tax=Rhodopirellula TaxID=265488 RepID=UPI000649BCC7|nr:MULTISPECIES: hypothetical protein [Rhodopirellula]WDQ16500.1 hypothetical protein PSR62_23185 [Rhodopirellula sp. P2]
MIQDFKFTTPTVTVNASPRAESKVPYGSVLLLVGGKNLFRWPSNHPFYFESILDVLNELANAPEASPDGATRLQRLSTTECLDGASFEIVSNGDTIQIQREIWPDWGDIAVSESDWTAATAKRDDMRNASSEFARYLTELDSTEIV